MLKLALLVLNKFDAGCAAAHSGAKAEKTLFSESENFANSMYVSYSI